jgi:hypothetical protein
MITINRLAISTMIDVNTKQIVSKKTDHAPGVIRAPLMDEPNP